MEEKFTQVCVWQGVVVASNKRSKASKDKEIKDFEKFMKDLTRIEKIVTFKCLNYVNGTSAPICGRFVYMGQPFRHREVRSAIHVV